MVPANVKTSTVVEEDCVVFRASGSAPFAECIELVTQAIRSARERGAERMLLDASRLRADPQQSIGLGDRFFVTREWAAAGAGMRLAMVLPPKRIDPQKFGVTVAKNVGLSANVFTSEAQARAWLLAPTDVPRTP